MRKYLQDVSVLDFYGCDIVTGEDENGEVWVPLKQIIEGHLGMKWDSFLEKMKRHVDDSDDYALYNPEVISVNTYTPRAGGISQSRDRVCIRLTELSLLLAQINTLGIKDRERKIAVLVFQKECQQALADYWLHGAAINTRKIPSSGDSEHNESPLVIAEERLVRVASTYIDKVGGDVDPKEIYDYAYDAIKDVTGIERGSKSIGILQYQLAFMVAAASDIISACGSEGIGTEGLADALLHNIPRAWNAAGSAILHTKMPFSMLGFGGNRVEV